MMHTHANKDQQAQTVAAPTRATESLVPRFSDQRPQAALQRKWQTMANYSPQVQQLKGWQSLAGQALQQKGVAQLKGGLEEEELLQGKFETLQSKPNNTGLPDNSNQRSNTVSKVIQRVKQPPLGNFPRYVNSNLTNSGVVAGVHPNDAEVAAEGDFHGASNPANPHGWANLQPIAYTLGGATGVNNTQITINPRIDHNGNTLYRMHLIHHSLANNANHNINNIVLGPHAFNTFHLDHVEKFMGDSMNQNFWNSSGGQSLNAVLLPGENIARTPAGIPYVVGLAPTFPLGLRTGAVLPAGGGVPANAHEITTDEDSLDRFVALWYFVRPIFGLVPGTIYANLFAHLNAQYLNRPAGATNWGENLPAGVLGAGGLLDNIATSLAGIYATGLEVKGSFFTPDTESIPVAGTTANNMPWKDSRIPPRILNNPAPNPFASITMAYDGGMGVMVNTPLFIGVL